jgi:hypothetical protein
MTDDQGAFEFDLIMPYRLIPPSSAAIQTHEVQARQLASMGELKASEPLLLTI